MSAARLLSAADVRGWLACYAIVGLVLVLTGFTSSDPDSALHAAISTQLVNRPVAEWIAPDWGGEWNTIGLYREHPIGVFVMPVLLGAAGIPAVQAAYVAGVGASVAALLLTAWLVRMLASREDGRAVTFLLLVMPVAFVFRIRANHEYPMLVCLLLALIGVEGVRRRWGYAALVAAALVAALLVKGVFVALVLLGAGLWIVVNPTRSPDSIWRPIMSIALGLVAMAVTASAYDAWYQHVTGEAFWAHYWNKQLGPLEIATPLDGAAMLGRHAAFYLSRLLWHPAPWSLVLVVVIARQAGRLGDWWRRTPDRERLGLVFGLGFAVLSLALLSPSSRFAERYAFSATFAVGTVGAVVSYRRLPGLRRLVDRLDRALPAAPAVVWLGLVLLRLGLGPLLPRW